MSTVRHGTYAGWNWHRKHGVPTCLDCKEAARQYQAKRRTDPEKYRQDLERNKVRSRALWRLADLHPGEFDALVADEMANIKSGTAT